MKHEGKVHLQPESTEKHKGHKPPIQSHEAETPFLAHFTRTGLDRLEPDDMVRLGEMVGNREVSRLVAQRQDDKDDEVIVGPRIKPLNEDAVRQRGSSVENPSSHKRGLERDTGNIGDAYNLDGQGCYGWDREMDGDDVANVVNTLLGNQSSYQPGKNIYIFSGHHGTDKGNLVGPVPEFLAEDQATATDAMANNPGSQIEVIDDPSTYPTKASMLPAFNSTGYIRILAWCFGKKSYENQANLKSNWWPEPDHINAQP